MKGDEADESGWTPLMIAVSAGRDDVAEYFLKSCSANPNAINSTGQAPLHYAASKNRLNVIVAFQWRLPFRLGNVKGRRQISQGLSKHSKYGWSNPFVRLNRHYACEDGNASVVRLLLQAGGDLSAKDKDGKTPIELAPDHLRVAIPSELGLVR
ncbi:unnamed protein product [Dibothriocephalus latus]|uniref:Uncharacterized protein n=1 Tax=Dibothriocephalus latus TaxID=60516 RepID=A0A3P7NWX4_DIBLA|nr:unnamed protein product [Dibothriocephalus latus]